MTVMKRLTCHHCGQPFEASRTDAKYCKPSCRTRAAEQRAEGKSSDAGQGMGGAGTIRIVTQWVIDHGFEGTIEGSMLIDLARTIGSVYSTGTQKVAAVKELRALLAEMKQTVPDGEEGIDDVLDAGDHKLRLVIGG